MVTIASAIEWMHHCCRCGMRPAMTSVARIVGSQSSFADRINTLLNRIECRPAYTHADIEAFLRLRYEAYVKEGAVLPNETRKLEDRFDLTGNAWNFGF